MDLVHVHMFRKLSTEFYKSSSHIFGNGITGPRNLNMLYALSHVAFLAFFLSAFIFVPYHSPVVCSLHCSSLTLLV